MADGRLVVAGIAFLIAAIIFVPGLLTSNLLVAVPFPAIAAAFVAAPQPPLDAAWLDVVPSSLWGRAEAVRSFARNLLQSFAPLLFGYVPVSFGGPGPNQTAVVGHASHQAAATVGRGLEYTFVIMLASMLVGGVLLLLSRRTYLVMWPQPTFPKRPAKGFQRAATGFQKPAEGLGGGPRKIKPGQN
ncbi:MAG TPA: hypothetical protein VEJ84_24440 [Acidimicrobiales bacterium]|nr:hypothetical protein [Acidimicrobiales bacterium]